MVGSTPGGPLKARLTALRRSLASVGMERAVEANLEAVLDESCSEGYLSSFEVLVNAVTRYKVRAMDFVES
jgi:hypothetical protein